MLAPWKKSHDKPRRYIKKQRHHFVDKGTYSQSYVTMYGCENWTIKMVECWRIHAFKLWCWGRLLRVPWTARRSNQSILNEINPKYSLQGLMLKLQSFGHLMPRTNSLEKTLMLGKIEGRRRGWQRMKWLDGITDITDMSLSKPREVVEDREACHAAVSGVTKNQTWLSNQTTKWVIIVCALSVSVGREGWRELLRVCPSGFLLSYFIYLNLFPPMTILPITRFPSNIIATDTHLEF